MIRFTRIGVLAAAAAVALAPVAGCSKSGNPASPSSAVTAGSQDKGKPAAAYQLNLSHVECVGDEVEIHFVLLNVPNDVEPPGSFIFPYGGGDATANRRNPKTGNVWHYSAFVPSGTTVNVGSFSIVVDGQTVWLHNPGAYAGTYECNENEGCPGWSLPENLLGDNVCLRPSDLGNEENECEAAGLEAQDKDNDLTGDTHTASQSALVAIVKNGRGTCDAGFNAYRFYVNVTEGQTLEKPAGSGSISHVTYCQCPTR